MKKILNGWRRAVKLIRDVFCKSASQEAVPGSSSELKTLFAGTRETSSNDWKIFFTDNASRPAGYRQALLIDGEEYGFRWIPPGEFDMGSPESEEDRDDNETLHHVILTKGFWLLETPVTQRLYH